MVEKYAPSRRWYIDILIKVLILAGNFVAEENSAALIHLIVGTPELQSYAVHKLFFSLQKKGKLNQVQPKKHLILLEIWHLLLSGDTTATDGQPVISLLGELLQSNNDVIEECSLSASIKPFPKLNTVVKKLIAA